MVVVNNFDKETNKCFFEAVINFFFPPRSRKWLPPPLRKLSQGKVEKNNTQDRPQLKKTPSDKRFRLPSIEMGNKQSSTTAEEELESSNRLENGEEGEEDAVELPPPMKPIQEPLLVPTEDSEGERVSEKTFFLFALYTPPPIEKKTNKTNKKF